MEFITVNTLGRIHIKTRRRRRKLFSQCTEHLPANETSILLSLVRDRDAEPSCRIDTDSILCETAFAYDFDVLCSTRD